MRVAVAASRCIPDFLTREVAFVVLAFVVLYKLCDAFAGAMTAPFVIDLGFTRNDYAAIVKGVGLAATLIGGFAGGVAGARLPLSTSLWIGGYPADGRPISSSRWLALVGINHWALTARHHGGELHRRNRHRHLRRLPVGALQQSRCTRRRSTRC